MTDAKIDIVITVYNPGRVFRKCIKSILNQSFKQWHLILIDDGSTDGSERLCDKYAEKDSRITVIHQKNQGLVAARKNGVSACDPTRFVTFCDNDDMLTPNALEKLYVTAVENNADMVCANSVRLFKGFSFKNPNNGPCYETKRTYSHQEIIDELYVTCFGVRNLSICLWANLYRYELISEAVAQPNKVKLFYEDINTMAYMLPRAQRLTIIPDTVYRYRIGGRSFHFIPSFFSDYLTAYPNMKKLSSEWPIPQDVDRLLKTELTKMVYSWLRMCREQGGYKDDKFLQEIQRVCTLPEVIEAVNMDTEEKKGTSFKDLLKDNRYDEIHKLIDSDIHKDRFKQVVRRLVMKR